MLHSRQSGAEALLAQAEVERLAGDDVRRAQAADGSDAVVVGRALPLILEVDGQSLAWRTRAQTVEGALAEAGFVLGPQDSVTLDGIPVGPRDRIDVPQGLIVARALSVRLPATPPDQSEATMTVRRAVPFTFQDGDDVYELQSGQPTVGLALRQWGIPVGSGDLLQPPPGEELTAGAKVTIERARPVTVSLGGDSTLVYTRADTVGDLLHESGISLTEDQRAYPAPESPVATGEADAPPMEVRVVTVSEDTYVESATVEQSTVYRVDAGLAEGETRRVVGSDGLINRQYRIDYEDGREVSRELIDEWYYPEPVDTVIYYGASPRYEAAGLPDGLDVARSLRVYATWYNPASAGRDASSPWYGITATGVPVTQGIVACDPSVLPLGTRMYIPGYGYGVCADTGGAIVGYIIDLGFPDGVDPHWSPGWIEIYILGP